MTEAEWLNCTDPGAMLNCLRESGRASERKLRLFAAACVRRVWDQLAGARSRHAVETSERYADGVAGKTALADAERAAWEAVGVAEGDAWVAAKAAAWTAFDLGWFA